MWVGVGGNRMGVPARIEARVKTQCHPPPPLEKYSPCVGPFFSIWKQARQTRQNLRGGGGLQV